MPINSVVVYLDENVPEYMIGILRIGSVVSDDSLDHPELIDNMEFTNETDLINHVASVLGVSPSIVTIET